MRAAISQYRKPRTPNLSGAILKTTARRVPHNAKLRTVISRSSLFTTFCSLFNAKAVNNVNLNANNHILCWLQYFTFFSQQYAVLVWVLYGMLEPYSLAMLYSFFLTFSYSKLSLFGCYAGCLSPVP